MFRTVPLSIIRSFSRYTQQWYMSCRFADSVRAGSGWNCSSILILLSSCMTYTIAYVKIQTVISWLSGVQLGDSNNWASLQRKNLNGQIIILRILMWDCWNWVLNKGMYYFKEVVAQWLRCCASNRKVAGLIPAGVSGFFIDIKSFRSQYGPGVDSASNRNEYQGYFLGVKAAGA